MTLISFLLIASLIPFNCCSVRCNALFQVLMSIFVSDVGLLLPLLYLLSGFVTWQFQLHPIRQEPTVVPLQFKILLLQVSFYLTFYFQIINLPDFQRYSQVLPETPRLYSSRKYKKKTENAFPLILKDIFGKDSDGPV